jgi:hypothetical protein
MEKTKYQKGPFGECLNTAFIYNNFLHYVGSAFENGENAQKMHFGGFQKRNFLGEGS